MGIAYVITSGKGGVGKTTTTANLGAALALAGKKVALLDADIGLRNLDLILGLERRVVFDLVDVVEGKCSLEKAFIKDRRFKFLSNDKSNKEQVNSNLSNLVLIPASQVKDKTAVSPEDMAEIVKKLKNGFKTKDGEFIVFDYVLIDSPAGIEHGFKNAIAGADKAIVVTTPEVSSVRDADRILGMLDSKKDYDPQLIINRIKYDLVEKGDMLTVDDVKETLRVDVLGVVPDDTDIVIFSNKGEPAVFDEKSVAGKAYRHIAARILDSSVKLNEFKPPKKGLFNFIRRVFIKERAAL